MAHASSPASAFIGAPALTHFPVNLTDYSVATLITGSTIATTNLILESMTCLVAPAGAGNIVISDAAATAALSITVTTVGAGNLIGTTIRFGAQGVNIGKGLKVVAAANTGTWLYAYRQA